MLAKKSVEQRNKKNQRHNTCLLSLRPHPTAANVGLFLSPAFLTPLGFASPSASTLFGVCPQLFDLTTPRTSYKYQLTITKRTKKKLDNEDNNEDKTTKTCNSSDRNKETFQGCVQSSRVYTLGYPGTYPFTRVYTLGYPSIYIPDLPRVLFSRVYTLGYPRVHTKPACTAYTLG